MYTHRKSKSSIIIIIRLTRYRYIIDTKENNISPPPPHKQCKKAHNSTEQIERDKNPCYSTGYIDEDDNYLCFSFLFLVSRLR